MLKYRPRLWPSRANNRCTAANLLRLSHWRKRLGDKLELLLAESLRVAHQSGALRTKDLARVVGTAWKSYDVA